jgi:membrane protease YdiL (CAAX protease family)
VNHLESVTSKNSKWYWYLLVFVLSWAVSNTIGAIPLLVVMAVSSVKNGGDIWALSNIYAGTDNNLLLACMMFAPACLLAAAVFLVRAFHGKTWTQVINGTGRIRWSRFFFGVAVWGAISIVAFAVSYFVDGESLTFRFDAVKFTVLFLISIVLIPVQTTSEEFIFRGYLMQGVASWTKSRWWAFVLPGILFGLMHGINPEIEEYGFWVMMSQYIFMGWMFGIITVLDDGAELAMGMHAINNFIACTLLTYRGAALETDALFMAGEVNPAEDLIWLVVGGMLAVAVFALKYRWNFRILNQKISVR